MTRRLKVVSLVLVLIGIVVISGALISLMLVDAERERYRIYYDSGDTAHFTYTDILEPDHEYRFTVTMHADWYYSTYGYDSLVEGNVVIYIDSVAVVNANLYDSEFRDDESGTGIDASDSAYYVFTPTSSVNVTIIGVITSGDDWTIEIFRDVPEELVEQAVVQLIYLVSGFILFIVGSSLFVKAKQTT